MKALKIAIYALEEIARMYPDEREMDAHTVAQEALDKIEKLNENDSNGGSTWKRKVHNSFEPL